MFILYIMKQDNRKDQKKWREWREENQNPIEHRSF